jgi:hypothetical protein
MKSSTKSNSMSERYKLLGFSILIIAFTYIVSDVLEWYLGKDDVILGFSPMPFYRRFLTYFYILIFGYGGYLLIRKSPKSWDLIVISMTSIIPSFFIIPLVWNVIYYTNWIEGLPFLLWYLFSAIIVAVFIIMRKDFGINNWVGRLSLILLINIVIRILHELILYNLADA